MGFLGVFSVPHLGLWAVVAFGVALAVTWALHRPLRTWLRQVGFFLLTFSTGMVVVTTLLRGRWSGGVCLDCLGSWGLARVLAGRINLEAWLNVALFVPPAFFAVLLWRAPWRTVAAAALGSFAIEIVQPAVGVGVNDLMDLVANTAGTGLGAAAGAVVMLVADSIRDRHLDLGRTLRVGLSLAVGTAIVVGGAAAIGMGRQAASAARLHELFDGSTLSDYQAHRADWDAKLATLRRASGRPIMTHLASESTARVLFTWDIYFTPRCVIAEWTPTGFDTTTLTGDACTGPR